MRKGKPWIARSLRLAVSLAVALTLVAAALLALASLSGGAGMDALLAAAFLLFSIELVASFLSPPEREPSFLRLRSPSARAPPSFA
jgi:hypothetical protein